MKDYLVVIEVDARLGNDDLLSVLTAYGLSSRRARAVAVVARVLGSAPVGYFGYEEALRNEALLTDAGVPARVIYTNKPAMTEIGLLKP